jgi:hypothetical protein
MGMWMGGWVCVDRRAQRDIVGAYGRKHEHAKRNGDETIKVIERADKNRLLKGIAFIVLLLE